MPTVKKDVTPIRDSVFLGADGAESLAYAVALLDSDGERNAEDELSRQLDSLMEDKLQERLSLLDRYAYAGFEWLKNYQKDESTIRELVLTALDEVSCVETEPNSVVQLRDPLLDMLLS